MLVDASAFPDRHTLSTDFCIIGSGPAGLTVGLELAKRKRDVVILEAGGLEPSASSRKFYEGESRGIDYPLAGSRMRALGGSSNCWGGWTRQLEQIEFTSRPWMPHAGWPIAHSEIARYYARAGSILNVDGLDYDARQWARRLGQGGPAWTDRSDVIEPRVWQVSVGTRLGVKYRDELARSRHATLVYNAAATSIVQPDGNGVVDRVRFSTARGAGGIASAKTFVLALGGIENARMLLNSPTAHHRPLGGASGWVGRGFMEHPARKNGWRIYVPGNAGADGAEDGSTPRAIPGHAYQIAFGFSLSHAAQRKHRLPAMWAVAGPASALLSREEESKARDLLNSMLRTDGDTAVKAFDITWAMEQSVNRESRIELAEEVDAHGMRRVALSWRISTSDANALEKIQRLVAADLLSNRLARMRVLRSFSPHDLDIDFGNHHMGSTRMAARHSDGVVDANCKMFETRNLYIAGSSVFPSSASTNPTLAITAMALRLAEFLHGTQI